MNELREYFKNDLIEGYEKKFNKKMDRKELNIVSINNQLFSIKIDENRIVIHSYDDNRLDTFLFNSTNQDEVFTHYVLNAEGRDLMIVATVYSYVNDNSIINTIGTLLESGEKSCANCEVFLGEDQLTSVPTNTFVKIVSKGDFRIKDFQDSGDIIINDKNPYHAILKNEGTIKENMKPKVRQR